MRRLIVVVALSLVAACEARTPLAPTVTPATQVTPQLDATGTLDVAGYTLAYRTHGKPVSGPRGVVLVLAYSADSGMHYAYGGVADRLVDEGWLHLSMDYPMTASMEYWASLCLSQVDFPGQFREAVGRIMQGLITRGIADPSRIAVVGYSRGGFMALHIATHPLISAVAAIMPVTDLRRVSEFDTLKDDAFAGQLSAEHLGPGLKHARVWSTILEDDTRVDTNAYRRFVAAMQRAGVAIDARVTPGSGHDFAPSTHADVSAWLLRR
jgi:dienelactone hydrolase